MCSQVENDGSWNAVNYNGKTKIVTRLSLNYPITHTWTKRPVVSGTFIYYLSDTF